MSRRIANESANFWSNGASTTVQADKPHGRLRTGECLAADSTLLGYTAISGSYIDRMFIHPRVQRRGAGARLLAKARDLSPAGLELHTHQQNTQARDFYEKHGFKAVKFGVSPPPESAPDVEYHWRPTTPSEPG